MEKLCVMIHHVAFLFTPFVIMVDVSICKSYKTDFSTSVALFPPRDSHRVRGARVTQWPLELYQQELIVSG